MLNSSCAAPLHTRQCPPDSTCADHSQDLGRLACVNKTFEAASMDDSLWVKHIRGNFHRTSSSLTPAQLAAARDTFYTLLVRTEVQGEGGGAAHDVALQHILACVFHCITLALSQPYCHSHCN